MVAAFGSGAMFSLVSGMGGPNQVANAITSGLFFALVQGGLFKVSSPKLESSIARVTKIYQPSTCLFKFLSVFDWTLL